MSPHNVNLRVVLFDTARIINASRRHFLELSLLFVLPLHFSDIVYPSSLKPKSFISSHRRFFSSSSSTAVGKSDIVFAVIFSVFNLLFSFFSTASITRSILDGFLGEPPKFTCSLFKSILVSFLPLTGTHMASGLILVSIFFTVAGVAGFMYCVGVMLSGAEIDFRDVHFQGFVILIMILFMGVMIYFQLEWYLADVIVVVESKRGFAPLTRSSYLVKGTKRVAFLISALYGFLLGFMSVFSSSSVPTPLNSGSLNWMLVLRSAAFIVIATILRLYGVAATAVLFIYCKGLRGESVAEMVDEFALSSNARSPYDGYEKTHRFAV